nr:EAL domain-containing protein [Lachnospiraceae bacterium]
KSFIDTFVNMGGTGCAIGLLFAMMLFGKRSSTKRLSEMALIPGIFNISELMVFGFPIIYNPLMIVPFLLSPILCFSNAFFLTRAGLLPHVINSVVWTTPPLMSGFLATESFVGVLVQVFNIGISTLCYAPFVVLSEKRSLDEYSTSLDALLGVFGKSKEMGEDLILTDYEGNIGRLAKHLANDLEVALAESTPNTTTEKAENPLLIFYQPQYDRAGKCIGAESLLRWNHMQYGVIAPPLVIEVAKESGDLYDLETYIIERAVYDSFALRRRFGEHFMLSVNVTVTTLYDKRFIDFLQDLADRYKLRSGNICLEITEDTDLVTTEETADLMSRIRSYGYTFALDDFNMGHTSLQYLQYNQFDIVKLDGTLVGAILDNDRAREIINSIVYLSQSLDFTIIAEYVETEAQRDALADIGCNLYQGYLYSPAVSRAVLISGVQPS